MQFSSSAVFVNDGVSYACSEIPKYDTFSLTVGFQNGSLLLMELIRDVLEANPFSTVTLAMARASGPGITDVLCAFIKWSFTARMWRLPTLVTSTGPIRSTWTRYLRDEYSKVCIDERMTEQL